MLPDGLVVRFAVIDFLTRFGKARRAEWMLKGMVRRPGTVTDPPSYRDRWLQALGAVFAQPEV